jgi:hypothetical protein
VKNGIQEVAGSVAGEGPTGAIGAVRTRRQPEYKHAGLFIAERWNRFSPINPIPISAALAGGDLFAILPQPGAAMTADDILVEKY